MCLELGKILSHKDLISKIFRNKDLASDCEPFLGSEVDKMLGELSRM